MTKNFGDILDEWDKITGKPYGKKQIKKDEHSNKKTQSVRIKEENKKLQRRTNDTSRNKSYGNVVKEIRH